jgi:hypothetical protein
LRSPQPALTVPLSDRCYGLDVVDMLAVVATADRQVSIFSLQQPATPYKVRVPPPPRPPPASSLPTLSVRV